MTGVDVKSTPERTDKLQEEEEKVDGRYTFVQGCFSTSVDDAFTPDIIIHLAGLAGVRQSSIHPADYVTTNVALSANMYSKTTAPVLYASSSSVYGDLASTSDVACREDMVLPTPTSIYALTKRMPYMLPGKLLSSDEIKMFQHASGRPMRRDFTYVKDIVRWITGLVLIDNGVYNFSVYNMGNGRPTTISEFIEKVENATGKRFTKTNAPAPKADVNKTHCDKARLKSELGERWSITPLDESVRRTYSASEF